MIIVRVRNQEGEDITLAIKKDLIIVGGVRGGDAVMAVSARRLAELNNAEVMINILGIRLVAK
jgi:hypothetical protein